MWGWRCGGAGLEHYALRELFSGALDFLERGMLEGTLFVDSYRMGCVMDQLAILFRICSTA